MNWKGLLFFYALTMAPLDFLGFNLLWFFRCGLGIEREREVRDREGGRGREREKKKKRNDKIVKKSSGFGLNGVIDGRC